MRVLIVFVKAHNLGKLVACGSYTCRALGDAFGNHAVVSGGLGGSVRNGAWRRLHYGPTPEIRQKTLESTARMRDGLGLSATPPSRPRRTLECRRDA